MMLQIMKMLQGIKYCLSEHPMILNFRWSPTQSWGSTWSFLFTVIPAYIAAAVTLHLILTLFRRRRPVPLGPVPAAHSLLMAVISAVIFVGMLLSAAAEIRDTRWLWRRTKTTPLQWLLCFPLGTRPSGRVFFWSYVFYLSRFLHLLRTFFTILRRRRRLTSFHLLNKSILIFTSFLWLEFSQSFQVPAILATTVEQTVVYAYRFWVGVGLRGACFPLVANCQVALLGCNLACHVGVLLVQVFKGGCNGIGAWLFNSVLNAAILLLFMKFYVRTHLKNSNVVRDEGGSSHWGSGLESNNVLKQS
ncbi:elongation of fatty acids protein 3-like [Argentina anserina]|uniref:elongation of fatty acids protein 3-like n=1 Tax=Argentina anserina TaxID=57926 RepID=UPI0021763972|nr:elongation of fatty acids protein 3-like [Potentilla anserina]